MAKINDIQQSYGKTVSMAISNTSLENVLNAYGLPSNTIIVNSEYDTVMQEDKGHPTMLITDFEGNPSILTRYIEEKNGLHSDPDNPNIVYLDIDNSCFDSTNNELSLNLDNLIDNYTLTTHNGKIYANIDHFEKASSTNAGVMKVDGTTIVSDGGTLRVATNKLDYANNNVLGIAKGDNVTIKTTNGKLFVVTENLQKTSATSYGVAKPDNVTIKSNNGVLNIDLEGVASLDSNGLTLNKADQLTIMQNGSVLSMNEDNLPVASYNNRGIVKIDNESLEVNQNGILEVKNYDGMFSYVYDIKTGINTVEEKISYIRNFIDNHEYEHNTSIVQHLSCNETTTTMLAKPQSMEEPINMELQHVYVSLNVVTNCDFSIDLEYENDETPTIELDNINYNDEYKISGIEAIEHTWESTGSEEKNIILLFNCKNFLSSTGPKRKTTKINIKISSKDNANEYKKIVYSIIRYNSYYINDIINENIKEIFDGEYKTNEAKSKWIVTNNSSIDLANIEMRLNSQDTSWIVDYAYLTDTNDNSVLNFGIYNSSSYSAYLIGVYDNVKTNESNFFVKYIDPDTLPAKITGKYVCEIPYKIDFDTLYYKLRYRTTASKVSFENGKTTYEIKQQNYKDNVKSITGIPYNLDSSYTMSSYLKFGSNVVSGIFDNNVNAYKYVYNDVNYAYMSIDNDEINVYSYLVKNNVKSANLYLVNEEKTLYQDLRKLNFDKMCDDGDGAKIMFRTGTEQYEIEAYLYSNINGLVSKNSIEVTYGLPFPNVYMYAMKKYAGKPDTDNNFRISYNKEFYSLVDNNIDIYLDNEGNGYEYISDITPVYDLSRSTLLDSYCYTTIYNIYDNDNVPYFENDKLSSFVVSPVSEPKMVISNIKLMNDKISMLSRHVVARLVSTYTINGENNLNNLVDSITATYSYINNDNLSIFFADNSDEYNLIIDSYINSTYLRNYSLTTCTIDTQTTSSYKFSTPIRSNEFNTSDYKAYDLALFYSYETNDISYYSNVVGDFIYAEDFPSFELVQASPVFCYEPSNYPLFYSYYQVQFPRYNKKYPELMEVQITQDDYALDYYNMTENSYKKIFWGTQTTSVLYSQKHLYNSYTLTDWYDIDLPIDDFYVPNMMFKYSNFYNQSYFGYINNSNKLVLNVGDYHNYIGAEMRPLVSLNTTLSYIIDNKQFTLNLSHAFSGYIIDDDYYWNVLSYSNDTTDIQNIQKGFLTSYGYDTYSYMTYYNTVAKPITMANGKITIDNDIDRQNYYDDAMTAFAYYVNGIDNIVENPAYMKVEIYNENKLAYSIVSTNNGVLLVDDFMLNNNNDSFIALVKDIEITNDSTIETPLAYVYNISNFTNGFGQYCKCEIYNDWFIPRFTKPYDKYFTPYDYTIHAFVNGDENDFLNKKVFFADVIENRPKIINVKFEVKYKNITIFEKTIGVNKDNNFDRVSYIVNDNKIDNKGNTTYFAYSYYTYSSTNKYLCSQLYSYMDVNYYANKFLSIDANGSQISTKKGIAKVSLNNPRGTYNLINTIDENKSIAGETKFYATKYDRDNLTYIWELSDCIDQLAGSYEFNLCQFKDNTLDIVPKLKSDYSLTQINYL